jgi:predicted MFS family arabinose efflux permease
MAPFIPNEIGFDTMRGLQGLGAAAMAPTALGILASTFPPGKAKDMAFGCFVIGAPLGSIFGQVFGGVVSQYLSWQWVYWIFGIMAAVSTVASYYIIPSPPPQPKRKNKHGTIDWIGGALITIGLVILIFALSQGNVVGWRTPWIPTLIALSLLIVVGFGYWQHYLETKTTKQPLMKMSIFKQKNFIAANVLMALFFSAFGTFIVFASYWFQAYQGLSVMQTSLRFIPNGITGIFVATITGYLMSRIRAEYILFFSTICIGLASLLFAIPIPVDTTYWAYGFPAMLLCVCGADTMYPVLTLFVTKTLPAKDASLGGALITAVGQIGRTIGLAIATALQMAIVAREKGVSVEKIDGKGRGLPPWDDALKVGIRTTAWFNFAISMTAALVVIVFIRGMGVIGGNRQSR